MSGVLGATAIGPHGEHRPVASSSWSTADRHGRDSMGMSWGYNGIYIMYHNIYIYIYIHILYIYIYYIYYMYIGIYLESS